MDSKCGRTTTKRSVWKGFEVGRTAFSCRNSCDMERNYRIRAILPYQIAFCILGGYVPKNVVLPRAVLCVGHDGKVAWDMKWRPHNASGSADKHIIGYLAVVLGNGSVEVYALSLSFSLSDPFHHFSLSHMSLSCFFNFLFLVFPFWLVVWFMKALEDCMHGTLYT